MAVNLALALRGEGAEVGIVDVDVYGPNIPLMIERAAGRRWSRTGIVPVQAYGVKVMSIGFFVKEGDLWSGAVP